MVLKQCWQNLLVGGRIKVEFQPVFGVMLSKQNIALRITTTNYDPTGIRKSSQVTSLPISEYPKVYLIKTGPAPSPPTLLTAGEQKMVLLYVRNCCGENPLDLTGGIFKANIPHYSSA